MRYCLSVNEEHGSHCGCHLFLMEKLFFCFLSCFDCYKEIYKHFFSKINNKSVRIAFTTLSSHYLVGFLLVLRDARAYECSSYVRSVVSVDPLNNVWRWKMLVHSASFDCFQLFLKVEVDGGMPPCFEERCLWKLSIWKFFEALWLEESSSLWSLVDWYHWNKESLLFADDN